MNLILTFVHPSKPPKTIGPFQAIRLDGDTVRETPRGQPVAVHREHQWEIEGQKYFRLDATTRVWCRFEQPVRDRRSRDFGPYERFSAVDGIAYTDDRVFAFVDSKVGDWFCYEDGQHWPVLIVSDATLGRDDRLRSLVTLAPMLPGVLALWHGTKLFYVGRAASLRSLLERLALQHDAGRITAISWEISHNPAAREAELIAEYDKGSATLRTTYGRLHGSAVRTARLIERARESIAAACRTCECARALRALNRA